MGLRSVGPAATTPTGSPGSTPTAANSPRPPDHRRTYRHDRSPLTTHFHGDFVIKLPAESTHTMDEVASAAAANADQHPRARPARPHPAGPQAGRRHAGCTPARRPWRRRSRKTDRVRRIYFE
ncbi:hypothetical protein HBB16_10540 [Pseudonocardia sp. MCCB 268]|nr:hypothetical protein [Pseudonocardia cytotoxica]